MTEQEPRHLEESDLERWTPPETIWEIRLFGALAPLAMLWPAIGLFINQKGYLPARGGGRLELYGFDAVLEGVAILFIATWMHMRYLWANIDQLDRYHELGENLSAIGCSIAIIWLVLRLYTDTFGDW